MLLSGLHHRLLENHDWEMSRWWPFEYYEIVSPDTPVGLIFSEASRYGLQNDTLDDVLSYKGGGGRVDSWESKIGAARILLRAATAAALNIYHSDVMYEFEVDRMFPISDLVGMVNGALSSEDRDTMIMLGEQLDLWNNAWCPLN